MDSQELESQSRHSPRVSTSRNPEAIRMNRQDSGYSDGAHSISTTSSRRTSRASSSAIPRKLRSKVLVTGRRGTVKTPNYRPEGRRSYNSTPNVLSQSLPSSRRPEPHSRYTAPGPSQLFHSSLLHQPQIYSASCTSLTPEEEPLPYSPFPLPAPPPLTIQYWTSDSTRRLEYAAIDAASRGIRGLLVRLVPDCILPTSARRTRFHREDANGSETGSVRRYRIALPEDVQDLSRKMPGQVDAWRSWWAVRFSRERDGKK